MSKVICEECHKQGLRSTVTYLSSYVTDMWCAPFYDEDGNYHHHDMNTTNSKFRCSNGHEFFKTERNLCPHDGCDWNKLVVA